MIRLFLTWLRACFVVDESRLRVRLYLREGLDLAAARSYWSCLTGIPLSQFGKPYRAVADPSRRAAKHPYGRPSIMYSCSATHRAILGLCEGLLA